MAPAANSSRARCACCRAKATAASRAARSASWLDTAACCRRGSICISGAPWRTRSPDFTRIWVIWPSICGWMVVDCSDFSVATYSVASSIGVTAAVARVTGVGGICGGGPALCERLQAVGAGVAHTVFQPPPPPPAHNPPPRAPGLHQKEKDPPAKGKGRGRGRGAGPASDQKTPQQKKEKPYPIRKKPPPLLPPAPTPRDHLFTPALSGKTPNAPPTS